MPTTQIVLIDHVSGVTPQEVQSLAAALNAQIAEDVAPIWGRQALVWVAPSDRNLSLSAWRLHLWATPQSALDAGALGHHETFGKNYVPIGHVFVQTTIKEGESWTSVASHEALEMLGDENINLDVSRVRRDGVVELWPRELCDAVQGLTYVKSGVPVSNFVMPEYFIEGSDGPFDYLKCLKHAFEIHHTGYSAIREVRGGHITDRDIYGAAYPAWRRALNPLSRKAARGHARLACHNS